MAAALGERSDGTFGDKVADRLSRFDMQALYFREYSLPMFYGGCGAYQKRRRDLVRRFYEVANVAAEDEKSISDRFFPGWSQPRSLISDSLV